MQTQLITALENQIGFLKCLIPFVPDNDVQLTIADRLIILHRMVDDLKKMDEQEIEALAKTPEKP